MNRREPVEHVGINLAALVSIVGQLVEATRELLRVAELRTARIEELRATAELQSRQMAEFFRNRQV